jgi:hypothetical protein
MTPLVEGGRTSPKYRAALILHTAGAVLGGIGAGALLGLIGQVLIGGTRATGGVAAVAAVGLVLGLAEIGAIRLRVMQMPRQTAKQWREWLGPVGAPLAWGVDLGSGLTTYVPFAAYWMLPLAVILRGDPRYGALLVGLFGLARALSVVVASLAVREAAAVPMIGEGTPIHAVLVRLRGHIDTSRRHHGWGVIAACAALLVYLITT